MSDKITLMSFEVRKDGSGGYDCTANFITEKCNFYIKVDSSLGDAILAICRGKIAEASTYALENLRLMAKEEGFDNE